jgi:hypothetical protein
MRSRLVTNGVPGSWGATTAIRGKDGDDATQFYTWIKYADDASGAGMSDSPTNKEYIGFAYNKPTPTESTNPADYSWSLTKGSQGERGYSSTASILSGSDQGYRSLLANNTDASFKPLTVKITQASDIDRWLVIGGGPMFCEEINFEGMAGDVYLQTGINATNDIILLLPWGSLRTGSFITMPFARRLIPAGETGEYDFFIGISVFVYEGGSGRVGTLQFRGQTAGGMPSNEAQWIAELLPTAAF